MRTRNFSLGLAFVALTSMILISLTNAAAQAGGAGAAPSALFTTLVNFDGINGNQPYTESLVQGKDGALYGTTFHGGGKNYGTVFKVTTAGGLTTLHAFSGEAGDEGTNPYVGLVLGANGYFYGATAYTAGSSFGTVFKMTPSGVLSTLHTFDQIDGQEPYSPLLQTADGSFYGVTQAGGANFSGTVFNITPPEP